MQENVRPRRRKHADQSADRYDDFEDTDRQSHVREAARLEEVAVLNKPVKPASLRALLGQWRTRQMVAAE